MFCVRIRDGISELKEGRGRIYRQKVRGAVKTWIYVPHSVATDSAFPFKKGEKVKVFIHGKAVIVRKIREAKSAHRMQLPERL